MPLHGGRHGHWESGAVATAHPDHPWRSSHLDQALALALLASAISTQAGGLLSPAVFFKTLTILTPLRRWGEVDEMKMTMFLGRVGVSVERVHAAPGRWVLEPVSWVPADGAKCRKAKLGQIPGR